jgi:hypothetical protein
MNELQVRDESFGWNLLFQINVPLDIYSPNVQKLLSAFGKYTIQVVKRETSAYINSNSRKRKITTSSLCA